MRRDSEQGSPLVGALVDNCVILVMNDISFFCMPARRRNYRGHRGERMPKAKRIEKGHNRGENIVERSLSNDEQVRRTAYFSAKGAAHSAPATLLGATPRADDTWEAAQEGERSQSDGRLMCEGSHSAEFSRKYLSGNFVDPNFMQASILGNERVSVAFLAKPASAKRCCESRGRSLKTSMHKPCSVTF